MSFTVLIFINPMPALQHSVKKLQYQISWKSNSVITGPMWQKDKQMDMISP
jgi:hypothetical protein